MTDIQLRKMVGEVNFADGIKSEAAQRLFNLLNSLLLAEKRPVTVSILEEAYLEMEGSKIPHQKFGFPSRLQLIATWFDRAWFRGQVVIVPIFTDQVAHLYPADHWYRSVWADLLKVDSWVPSLFLASAAPILASLKAHLKLGQDQLAGLNTFGLPVTVTKRMQMLLHT